MLAQAEAHLARGEFVQAERQARALLQADVPGAARAAALVVVADAAYAQRAYATATRRYGEVLATHGRTPAAARAALGLGWVELRQGDRRGAQRSWIGLADRFPADPLAPLALVLAAEVASDAGDLAVAHVLLDRVVARHPGTPPAEAARLSRAILLLRRGREDDALRDLDTVVSAGGGITAIDERGRLRAALAGSGREHALIRPGAPVDAGETGGDSLERFARAALVGTEREAAPYLLHGLASLAATRRGWDDLLVAELAHRLVDEFGDYPAGVPLLARVAAAALSAQRWAEARQAYAALVAHDPGSAIARGVRLDFAEALLRAGDAPEARRQLARAAANGAGDSPRALLLQVEIAQALGDPHALLAAHEALVEHHPDLPRPTAVLLTHARLLEDLGQPARARAIWQRIVAQSSGDGAAEAAYRVARSSSTAGDHQAALEWYLTAAYVAPASRWASRALLGAGESMVALNDTGNALALYRRLVPARLEDARPEERAAGGEAAYRAGEILRNGRRYGDALDMYLTAAHLTAGSTSELRALVGAMQCLVATGDRESAEALYRRLLASRATGPEDLAAARRALHAGGPAASQP